MQHTTEHTIHRVRSKTDVVKLQVIHIGNRVTAILVSKSKERLTNARAYRSIGHYRRSKHTISMISLRLRYAAVAANPHHHHHVRLLEVVRCNQHRAVPHIHMCLTSLFVCVYVHAQQRDSLTGLPLTSAHTHTHTRLTALCPGLPG